MTDNPIVWLCVGIAILAAVLIGILIWDSHKPKDDVIEDDVEQAVWEEKSQEVALDFGLAATRAAAGKWAASAAAILGILSTVAIVAGPDNLVDDVGGPAATLAGVLVLCAGGLAAVATLLAGTAEQGSPIEGTLTPGGLRAITRVRAKRAAIQIRYSRFLTVAALVLIIAAAGVAWLTALTKKTATEAQSAIVVSTSSAACGKLGRATDGSLTISVGTNTLPVPGSAAVTLVDSCP